MGEEPMQRIGLHRARNRAGLGPAPEHNLAAKAADFPGCEPVRISRADIGDFESRLERWDMQSEIAWMVREPSAAPYHEKPSHTLAGLVSRIAEVRGAPIQCFGPMDLQERGPTGTPQLIIQADQCLYLHPVRPDVPGPRDSAMVVGEHDLPDVVLEVDRTTDSSKRKLANYQFWRFPEIWIEVPDHRPRGSPKKLQPGLVIYLLQRGGAYLESATSRAFPSWRAEEIHRALNEQTPSERTYESIRRVGAALGSRKGTGPDDDPLLSAYRRQACERGRAGGLAEGRVDRVRQILLSRGSEVSEGFAIKAWETWNLPERTLVDAALRCRSEADFRARLAR